MIKLKDLISTSFSKVVIMEGAFEMLRINACKIKNQYLSTELLEAEVDGIEAFDNCIRVWLKNEEEEND